MLRLPSTFRTARTSREGFLVCFAFCAFIPFVSTVSAGYALVLPLINQARSQARGSGAAYVKINFRAWAGEDRSAG
jgi:hypothetical protein